MTGSIVFFSLLAVAGRELKDHLGVVEIMFYRSVIGTFLITTAALMLGRRDVFRPVMMPLQFVRNLVHWAGQLLWFTAVAVAPLTQVFALEFTMPIWVLILAVPILGERLTRNRVLTALAGFAGVLLVVRAWELELGPGVPQAALAALGFGATAVFTRRLTRSMSVLGILFWLSVMQGGFSAAYLLWEGHLTIPDPAAWKWLIAVGAGGIIAHLSLTTALSLAPASVVIPIDFARLPLIGVVAFFAYGEPLDMWVFVGALIIFGANYLNILRETRRK